jgi:sulfite exporter TauE/SafE
MGIGTSLVLIAIGAVLKFAVTASVSGVKLDVVGTILMVIGIVGLVITLIYTVAWNDRRRDAETVVERRERY